MIVMLFQLTNVKDEFLNEDGILRFCQSQLQSNAEKLDQLRDRWDALQRSSQEGRLVETQWSEFREEARRAEALMEESRVTFERHFVQVEVTLQDIDRLKSECVRTKANVDQVTGQALDKGQHLLDQMTERRPRPDTRLRETRSVFSELQDRKRQFDRNSEDQMRQLDERASQLRASDLFKVGLRVVVVHVSHVYLPLCGIFENALLFALSIHVQ